MIFSLANHAFRPHNLDTAYLSAMAAMMPASCLVQLLSLSRPWLTTLLGGVGLLALHLVLTALLVPLARQLEPLIQAFQWPVFLQWLGSVLVLYAGRNLCLGWQQYLLGSVSLQASQSYQHQLHQRILTELTWPEVQQHTTGDWLVKLQDDIDKVRVGLLKLWSEAVPGICLFVTMLGLAAWYNWRLTFILLVLLSLMAVLLNGFGHWIQQNSGQVQQRQGHLQQFMWESMQHWLILVATRVQQARSQQFAQQQRPVFESHLRLLKWTAAQPAVIGFVHVLLIGLLLLYSGWEIAQGRLTGADLLAFATAIALAVDPLLMMTGAAIPLQIAAASLARLRQIEQMGEPPVALSCVGTLLKLEGASIVSASHWQLRSVDFTLKPGERLGVVGPSGAGKSTLLLAAAGLYPLTQGKHYYDPSKNVVLLAQKPPVFSLSLRDNITLGRAINPNELAHVLAICQLTERIQQWPKGLDSLIGADGLQLSGGEKQLVALARALIGKPDALLLDEATSELDTLTEARLMAALEQAFPHLAWVMVSHRFSSLTSTSCRYVMDSGQILASGTHTTLLETCALYRELSGSTNTL